MDAAIEGTKCELGFSRPAEDTLLLRLSGDWRIGQGIPSQDEVEKQLQSIPGLQQVTFDTRDLTEWDSAFLTFLIKVFSFCDQGNITPDKSGLPEGVRRLLELAFAVPEKKDTGKGGSVKESFLYHFGDDVLAMGRSAGEMLGFIGGASVAFIRFLAGKASFRRSDLFLLIQDCGAQSLPIVSLISFLVGLILAFVGAVQLQMFGAQIYVADLVGIAMTREMGAMMAGIIMAGRTGAAFAAQLGTMQVNEEIDALTTMGVSPMEFLVLPRMLALIVMMPLLCLYADLMGIIGGLVVGVGMLDLTLEQYYLQTVGGVSLINVGLGVGKSVVYGALIAVAGCLRGLESGRSASAVGEATTSAVVTAIVAIIVSDGIFNVITSVLGI